MVNFAYFRTSLNMGRSNFVNLEDKKKIIIEQMKFS